MVVEVPDVTAVVLVIGLPTKTPIAGLNPPSGMIDTIPSAGRIVPVITNFILSILISEPNGTGVICEGVGGGEAVGTTGIILVGVLMTTVFDPQA